MKYNQIFKTAVLLLSILTITSCSKSEKEEAIDIGLQSTDIIRKVDVIMHNGHLHTRSFHGNPPILKDPLKRIQRFTLEKKNGKWERVLTGKKYELAKDEPIIIVGSYNEKQIRKNYGSRYAFEVIFYDKEGKRVNSFFEKNSDRFQGFYTVDKYTDLDTKAVVKVNNGGKDLLYYRYRDTKPENLMIGTRIPETTHLTGLSKNLLGLKGYFAVKKGRISYNLKMTLREWLKGEKTGNDRYNELFTEDASAYNDVSFDIPVCVVADRINISGSHTKEVAESYKKYKNDVAKYFGIPLKELEKIWSKHERDESSQFWM